MSFAASLDSLTSHIDLGRIYRAVAGVWGVYDSAGRQVAAFDTFFSVDVKAESKVTQNPVEQGSFAAYNKVATPAQIGVVLGRSGSALVRAAILDRLELLASGTDLISVVTPDRTFDGYTLSGYDYSYSAANGVDRLVVSLSLQEVRQVAAQYSDEQLPRAKCKNPTDASTVDAGKQQGGKPGPSTLERARRAATGWW